MSKQIIEIDRMDYAVINLQLRHAELLSKWASVGRTIDQAINILIDHASECSETSECVDDLYDLKDALDDVGHACKVWDQE